jgi:hypothetical protein
MYIAKHDIQQDPYAQGVFDLKRASQTFNLSSLPLKW